MAPSDDDRPLRTLAADAFLGSVEAEARHAGTGPPGIHQWVLAACSHRFLVRMIAPDVDIDALGALARERLAAGDGGETVTLSEVVALATRCARDRGDERIQQWHVCRAVLERAGVACAVRPAKPPDTPVAEARPVPQPSAVPAPRPAQLLRIGPPMSMSATPPKRRSQPPLTDRRATPMLDHAGRDLTALARSGALVSIVGRDVELDRIVEILCRSSKPNPLLVGEPGTGKTALVEGLAARIVAGAVPERLRDRRLIALDIMWLVQESGTYGRLEQRLSALLDEARATRAILFADELTTLLGAGGQEQKADVASLIKPVLARGDIPFISATTDDEYRRHIQADRALDRRFLVLRIQEPSADTLATIVETVARTMALHEGVTIDAGAIRAIPEIAAIRLPDRREPDRSKEIVEQAIAAAVAAGATTVDRRAIEVAASRGVGVHEPTAAALVGLEEDLGREGILAPEDAGALVTRLAAAWAGVTLRPQRPPAVVLLIGAAGANRGSELASAVASAFLGSPDRVVTIDVGAFTGPSAVAGLLGTQQGYVGYQAMLPIHRLLQAPDSVVRFTGLATCDPTVRAVIAQGLRHGVLVDGSGRRIALASAVVVLEVSGAPGRMHGVGFRSPGRPAAAERAIQSPWQHAADAIGRELAEEVDLVVGANAGGGLPSSVARLLGRLARRYEAMGSGLTWDLEVEQALRDACAIVGADRERERLVEDRVARAVRHLLGRLSEVARVHLSMESGSLRAIEARASTEIGSHTGAAHVARRGS